MLTTDIRIHAYDLCTPKYFKNRSYVVGRYDHEQIAVLLYLLMQQKEVNRMLLYRHKMINLHSYHDSDDSDIVEGKFITARYGKTQEIMDVYNQTVTGTKNNNEGVINEVYFTIDKVTGLILVEHDDEHVISREILQRYFKSKMGLVESYIQKFNKLNKEIMTLPRSAYVSVTTVPSKGFFDELNELTTIKEVYVYSDIEEGTNNDAIQFLAKQASENELEDYQGVKISLINKLKRKSIKHVEAYIRSLMELEAYDGYGVIGSSDGRRRQIDYLSNSVSMSYVAKVSVNVNGIINFQDLISEMVRISKYDNPIEYKRSIPIKPNKVYGDDNYEHELESATTKD
ncbi:hypothetical protein JJQ72_17475 [Paenibacillus sp. F411]|uniref:hypothetical protein n=1 Tax=Paenibacillus sp. F411 TaxID=2820239 RepID=UPI001AAF3D9D|nr:hypothetical protein [Paenibacillus sp. F411]MBO2945772.1 hypothetical protein [Paenibacillus sp. F411]